MREDSVVRENIDGRVLVVDDEASIRNVVKMFLEYHGLTVVTASDGEAAIKLINEEPFDVVLTDIMMPKIDGLTLAGEVEKIQPETLIILMTGFASVNTAVEAIKRDVFDYILKPFQNMQIVFQSIKRAIERKQLLNERTLLVDDLSKANTELEYHRNLLEKKVHAIDNELSHRVERLTVLYDISRSATSITNLDQLLANIMLRITSVFHDTVGIMWLTMPKKKQVDKVVTEGVKFNGELPDSIGLFDGVVGDVVRSGHSRRFRNIDEISDPVIKKFSATEQISSLILLPLRYEKEVLGVCGIMFRDSCEIVDDDISLLEAITDQASVSIKNAELYMAQQRMFRETIEALATAIDSRDHYTGGHSNMVTSYAVMIAEKMNFSEDRLEKVRMAGILHDVGKIGIADSILNKPGRLTDEEMEVIKAHPVIGRFILESIDALRPIARIIYHHHEHFDGNGYPEGISGEDIPLESRILQVADVFDAITSDRVYRKAMPREKALAIIRDSKGNSSDPEIVQILLDLYDDGAFEPYLA